MLPLSRFTVLDLTRVRSGPTCVRQLADWGANVIKIEAPDEIDTGKGMGGDRHGPDFQHVHRNKRGITLNLKNPEGVALWNCDADQRGYWVAVDQLKPTLFRVFDRDNLRPMGTFTGDATANTDGIALYAAGTPRFPAGVLYAVDDDLSLSAFDLGEVARALNLSKTCQP